ncbi:MAG: hypothetical protein ACFCUR_03305 [Rhodomicrobiaceae bacterium]
MTAEEVRNLICEALDGIELLNNPEREKLLDWCDRRANLGIWGLPGVEILRGIHNKCVLECREEDPEWNKAGFVVDLELLSPLE